ncbi:hypothetical protein [Streptomyces subrutilus]|uniref:Uncharacterized protein n=1 Tax=Streptomyces subrutilus TaxID=36818 RepID=A0A1E5NXU9_9ACTN|nr:hypothetical protein [Streptomyces subrutilus]OEJ21089.1 hypothetical protein BGK67_34930 [Streptomyces subrutilus]
MSRMTPPDPGFLPGIRVDTSYAQDGAPVVILFHPHAHTLNVATEAAMLAIASRLGLRYGRRFPRTGEYVYDIHGQWCLDYGHPRDVLQFYPGPVWPHVARGFGGALVAVSLEHEPRPAEERLLTGRLALRHRAPRDWAQAR